MARTGGHTLREQEDQAALDIVFSLIHMLVKDAHFLPSLPLKWSELDQMFLFSV